MSNTFIVVEGQPDVEFVAALLEAEGYKKVVMVAELGDHFCDRLIVRSFPYKGDLHRRVPNPMFLWSGANWIAIQAAGGATPELVKTARNGLMALQPFPGILSAIGIVRDADDGPAEKSFGNLRMELASNIRVDGYEITIPSNPGAISQGNPRLGIFILPDNAAEGTLEDLLLECGESAYPNLISGSQTFVSGVDIDHLKGKDAILIKKPTGKKKAVFACAANILKPGMSIATSIDQNNWLNDDTRELPRVKSLNEFLTRLCGIG